MPMNKTTTATDIQAAILSLSIGEGKTIGDLLTAEQKSVIITNWEAVCDALITRIVADAVITVNIPASTVIIAATGGVSNPTSISLNGTIA